MYSSTSKKSGTKHGSAVAVHHGPTNAASKALAKDTATKVGASLAKHAPVGHVADGRAFHLEEYRRASQLIKSLRANAAGATKPSVQQEWVDALAVAMAAVFEADSKQFGVPFSPAYFVAGTR